MTTLIFLALLLNSPLHAEEAESWLPSLQTQTPEEGFQLALTLARKGVTETQGDPEVLHGERPKYSQDAESLIAASQVVATHFQTIAAANDYWRD
ncbi:hypothetical protein J2T60_001147 [Natronospira proteinivora]|uniref:Hexameric tyrosine-coordinated heme protein (HTHP) n=1 Tax=Natronospira proteinivora TaxID=1807133 RepID=A0ABT1G807_9GAMM|nr:hexameric tyrosine-coordinated heme protein [Natronospira proteinivora]MCP1727182.1 hypothetical protein [Natronospira proteinivora]